MTLPANCVQLMIDNRRRIQTAPLRAAFAGQLVPQDPNDEPASVLLERIRADRDARTTSKKPRGRKSKEPA